MRCVAAPVFDEMARPIGGVSISGPTVRMTDAKAAQLGPQVAAAAGAITQAIGGRVPK
jgi:IclR family acetate operon transcriptional repressor